MEIGLQYTTEKVANNTIEKTTKEYHKLSIQVSLNGLSFCIVDTLTNKVLQSETSVFETERTPHGLQKGLVALIDKNDIASKTFVEVIVIHRNKLFSLVPKPLFDTNELANYLKFNTRILANDHLAFDEIESYDMMNVYVPFTNVNNYIYDLFGEFTFKHSGTVMVESLLGTQNRNKDSICYVHIAHQQMEITVIQNKTLLLYNSFEFNTKEDFIYYLLFTFEQLKLDTESTPLKLFGDVEEGDRIYDICYEYVNKVSIFAPSINSYPMDFDQESIDFTVLNSL